MNIRIVGNHHSNRSEERFEIVWQFRTTSIAWIHCDKDITAVSESEFSAFEVNRCEVLRLRLLDL